MVMKKTRLFVSTMLSAAFISMVFPQSIIFAAEKMNTPLEIAVEKEANTARYVMLRRVIASGSISNSGMKYNLYVAGIADITEISGWATLYKKDSSGNYYEVSSESFYGATNDLAWNSILDTDGPGTYKLEIEGTAYTADDSEDFSKSIVKSY